MPINDKKINPLLLNNYKTLKEKLKFFLINYLKRIRVKLDNDVIWFIDIWSKNYFHWLTDAMPRLLNVKSLK